MSRIGKKPVSIPDGIKVAVSEEKVTVEGPKGKLEQKLVGGVTVVAQDNTIVVGRVDESRGSRANQGLMRSLISNMVDGALKGFERVLEIKGVGYRAELSGRQLTMHLGYSHPVVYDVPDGIELVVDKPTRVVVRGASLQAVGQAASTIRAFKIPDPYKIKGVIYEGEVIKRKAGKKAVT